MSNLILLVDDDELLARAVGDVLEDFGFSVAFAENGECALDYLAENEAPRLILLDIDMPVMNGYAFRQRQLEIPGLAAIPTIVMTGGYPDQRLEALEVDGWLRKPAGVDTLMAALRGAGLSQARASVPVSNTPTDQALFSFVSTGLLAGESALLVTTAGTWQLLRTRLAREPWLARAERSSQLVHIDAELTLRALLARGTPTRADFERLVGDAVLSAARKSAQRKVRIFGELVDLLWRRGEVALAIRVGQLWNGLVRCHPFASHCSCLVDGDDVLSAHSLSAIAEVQATLHGADGDEIASRYLKP